MTKQIPRGPENVYCPQWRKPMSKVCHTCAWYVETKSKSLANGDVAVVWECAISAAVTMQNATAQMVREVAGETNALRNELVRSTENTLAAAETYQAIVARRERPDMKLIEGSHG